MRRISQRRCFYSPAVTCSLRKMRRIRRQERTDGLSPEGEGLPKEMERKAYLYLTDSGTFPGWVVKRVTRYPYSHAMLSLRGDGTQLHSFGRRSIHNFLNGGFVTENWDGPFFSHFSKTQCTVYELPLSQAQFSAVETVLEEFCREREKLRYDFAGCFLRLFGISAFFPGHYTCSHFVAEVLQRSGIHSFPEGTATVRPSELAGLPGARCIYTGRLRALPSAKRKGEEKCSN